jgi:hypothetical protein
VGIYENVMAAFRPRPMAALPAPEKDTSERTPRTMAHRTPPQSSRARPLIEVVRADAPWMLNAFQEAERGRVARLIDACKSTRVLDSRLDATCAQRIDAIKARPVVFKPPPGFESDAEALEITKRVTRLWNSTPDTNATLSHLAHGVLEIHAGMALQWVTDRHTGWWKPIPRFIHPNRFSWNEQAVATWVDDPNVWPGRPLHEFPDQFIFHAPVGGRSDYPWRRGAMRARLIPSILKRFTTRAWLSMLERWGQPQVAAFVDKDDPQLDDGSGTVEADVIEALRKIGVDWRAAFPSGVKLEAIDVSVSDSLHKNFIEWANIEDAIAILGQNTSTEVAAGSFAAAAAQVRVRFDILAADCAELAETLTHQWVEPVVRYNWPGAPIPYAEFVLNPKRELTVTEYQAGLYTADEVRTSQGHEPEPDGKGRRYYVGQAIAGTPTATEPSKPSDTKQPGPSKHQPSDRILVPGVHSEERAAEGVETTDGGTVEKLADAALNGAQMAAFETIVSKVETGARAPKTAVEMITAEFASITRLKAEAIMSTIELKPTDEPAPAQEPAPEPTEQP